MQNFGHVVTSIVQHRLNLKCQAFTRGEAAVIFNECSDYWDGTTIQHITDAIRVDFKSLLARWNDGYETIGFSYKPLSEDIEKLIRESSEAKHLKIEELAELKRQLRQV